MDIEMAEVTEIVEDKIKVKFNKDDAPSALEYTKLSSYTPTIADKVLMLRTNTSFICLGGIGEVPEEAKVSPFLVGEYKFFAKDKGLLWQGWARCDGRALSSGTYASLYAEIGTTFGGSGGSFNLPNAAGRVLSDANGKTFGQLVGTDSVTLTTSQMPKHSHTLSISDRAYEAGSFKIAMHGDARYTSTTTQAMSETGSGTSHENRQPTLYGGYYYIYTGVM